MVSAQFTVPTLQDFKLIQRQTMKNVSYFLPPKRNYSEQCALIVDMLIFLS